MCRRGHQEPMTLATAAPMQVASHTGRDEPHSPAGVPDIRQLAFAAHDYKRDKLGRTRMHLHGQPTNPPPEASGNASRTSRVLTFSMAATGAYIVLLAIAGWK